MNIQTFVQGAAIVFWIITVGLIILGVMRSSQGKRLPTAKVLIPSLVVASLFLTILSAGLVFLEPQERGIVISPYVSQGYRTTVLDSGLHWIIPGETVRRYSIARQTYTMSIAADEGQHAGDDSVAARTADGQEIFVDASVIYAINPDRVVDVHIAWQDRYTEELVRPQVRGIIRNVISQYSVEEVVSTKRFELLSEITETLRQKLDDNGLVLIDFVLRNITFTPEYAYSIEQKQIAEQQALQAQFVVEQKKQEAEQARQIAQGQADAAVIQAKGTAEARIIEAKAAAEARIIEAKAEAEALRLVADVLKNNPELLQYQYITKLAPGIRVILLPSDAPFILPPEVVTTP
ncbi:MAG: SPFH domain-containing protein [Anaerolineales bacterium]|nr:SPFH domain-containing protein [Anaerolineales bacterium]MCX7608044.1 SPFH domain-containing protein [Anaerolineales bacterium]MDW8226468.1 SPFH domain-containing protein [Anaerolineales bacterium]